MALLTVAVSRTSLTSHVPPTALGAANLALFSTIPPERSHLTTMLLSAQRASYSVVGSRILLNMRGAFYAPVDGRGGDETPSALRTMSAMFPAHVRGARLQVAESHDEAEADESNFERDEEAR